MEQNAKRKVVYQIRNVILAMELVPVIVVTLVLILVMQAMS